MRGPSTPQLDSRSKPYLADLTARGNRPLAKRDRSLGLVVGLAVHALLLLFLFKTQAVTPEPVEPPAVMLQFIAPPAPVPAPSSGAPPKAVKAEVVVKKKPKPPPPAVVKARVPKKIPPPAVKTIAAAPKLKKVEPEEPEEPIPQVSEAQVASAARAGTGQGAGAGSGKGEGGGSCDMARAIQNALRKDPLVAASVAEAQRAGGGKALLVWNGDWVRSHSQEGRGLSAVREAIIWEVGFASEHCRNQPMKGLVMFSLNSSRLVVGQDRWRWSDMLNLRR
jgi:hypothetical protein